MKKLVIGFIAGVVFASSGSVMASTLFEKVEATVRSDYTLKMDGNAVTLTNSPLLVNGSSYLPVREVATLLGKEIGFSDGVIALNTKYDDPAEMLAKLREDESSALNNISVFENELKLNKEQGNEAQAKKTEAVIATMKESLEFYRNRIADLLERYPELN